MARQTIEDLIYDQQYELIKERFGRKAADEANYGWFVDACESRVIVSTKVYGHGILQSSGSRRKNITHDMVD
jgi:hypothetical protein